MKCIDAIHRLHLFTDVCQNVGTCLTKLGVTFLKVGVSFPKVRTNFSNCWRYFVIYVSVPGNRQRNTSVLVAIGIDGIIWTDPKIGAITPQILVLLEGKIAVTNV